MSELIRRGIVISVASICSLICALPVSAAEPPPPGTSITADSGHTCATLSDGTVDCWGRDYITNVLRMFPTHVPGIQGAIAVSAGMHYNCALMRAGTVDCWGDD